MKKCLMLMLVLGVALATPAAKNSSKKKKAVVPAKPDATAIQAAIKDLMATYGKDYPNGRNYLKQLENADEAQLAKIQREALAANPLVSGQPILFVARKQYRKDHHNTATIFSGG